MHGWASSQEPVRWREANALWKTSCPFKQRALPGAVSRGQVFRLGQFASQPAVQADLAIMRENNAPRAAGRFSSEGAPTHPPSSLTAPLGGPVLQKYDNLR